MKPEIAISLTRILRKSISRAMLVVALAATFVGCTDEPEKPKVEPHEVTQWVDERLQNEYYWLDIYKANIDNFDYSLDYNKFLSTSLLSLTGNEMDGYVSNGTRYLYSYITRESTGRAAEDRMMDSFGITIAPQYYAGEDDTAIFVVNHVYPGSSAAAAGLMRGDLIIKVDGETIPDPNLDEQQFDSICDKLEYGTGSITIEGERLDRESSRYITYRNSLTSASYDPNPVAHYSVLELDEKINTMINPEGKKIGYISYLSFDSDWDDKLIEAMSYLAEQEITDLILDLRTNGGGKVNSSIMLASMLLSEEYIGKTYATLKRHPENTRFKKNELNTECLILKNGLGEFKDTDLPNLNLPELWVIASNYTASASEMVIKGFEGLDVPVHIVGKTTNGKNCGMDLDYEVFGQYLYSYAPITFMNYNGKGDNDYADGITPNVDFNKYYDKTNPTKDLLSYECYVFPLPRANWAEMDLTPVDGGYDFNGDFALYETVLQIFGYTTLKKTSLSQININQPAEAVTRATTRRTIGEVPRIPNHRAYGATLTEQERMALEEAR